MAITDKTSTYVNKVLFTGTQAAIEAATRTETGLYFATDTHKIYKGTEDYSQEARIVTALPTVVAKNALYVIVDNSGNFVKAVATNGSAAQTEISWAKTTEISSTSSDAEIPTAAAVKSYVDGAIGGDSVVHTLEASTTAAANLLVDSSQAVEVPGVALIPTWESTTRTLTIPYTAIGSTTASSVVMNLGLDAVVNYGDYDATTETLRFWLTTHDHEEYPNDPSFTVPVADLIDEIQVADTDSLNLTYTTSTNTISGEVIVSGKTGNALQLLTSQTTAADNGFYVDLSDYATTSAVAAVADDVTTLDGNVDALYTAVTTWTTLTTSAAGE